MASSTMAGDALPTVGSLWRRFSDCFDSFGERSKEKQQFGEIMAGGMFKRGLHYYHLQLQTNPLLTKAITVGVLAGCSDSIAQKVSGIQRLQLRRLLLKVLYGFAYGGPFGHFFHKVMDIIFQGKRDSKTAAKKVLVEQLTSSPWNNLLFMIYYGVVVEGRPWVQVKSKLKKDYPSVQLTAWMFWPIVGWINHRYMPLQFRVIFHSFVACCWSIFLNLRSRSMYLK